MLKKLTQMLAAAAACATFTAPVHAGSTDWVSEDAFYDSFASFREQWMEPGDLAVRIRNGEPQYKTTWVENSGPFSWAIYPTSSRAEADDLIQMHAEAENLIGGPSRLCLHKFARAVDSGQEYYLLYLVDGEKSGRRCISLPTQ